jgi:hypothetical protein
MSEKLTFDLVTGKNNLKSELQTSQKEASKLQSILETAAGVFAGNVATASFNKFTSAVGSAIGVLGKAVDASAVQEKAVNDLNNSLAQAGNLIGNTSKELQEFAAELQQASTFGDEAIISNIALLQSLTKLDKDGLQGATRAAADLAARLGIDLESATRLVARAANGQVEALRRYGIEVQKGSSDSQTFANALEQINNQFGGAAASQLNTFAGVTQAVSNALGDFLEPIGDIITKNPLVIAGLRTFKEIVEGLTGEAEASKDSVRGFVNDGIVFVAEGAIVAAEGVDVLVRSIELIGRAVIVPIQGLKALGTLITDTFGITKGASDDASRAIVENFDKIVEATTNAGAFSSFASKVEEFKNKSIAAADEIAAKQDEQIKNGEKRASNEEEVNSKIFESRQRLSEQLLLLEADKRIKEQELALEGIAIEDEKRQTELQRLIEFENEKTALIERLALERADRVQDVEEKRLAQDIANRQREIKNAEDAKKQQARILNEKLVAERIYSSQLTALVGTTANALSVITKKGSKEEFAVRQASALANALVATYLAIAQANAVPPKGNIAAIAAAKAQGAVAISGIVAQSIKGFQQGGVVGGFQGSSIGQDNTVIAARDGEMILNADQQRKLFNLIESGGFGGDIVVQVDGREIARAVRDQQKAGFVV